jgi:hypothetical protein
MYVLILTLLVYRGIAIDHVPGFTSLQSCLDAGNAWIKNTQDFGTYLNRKAVCVKL